MLVVRLAMILTRGTIDISPRDATSQEWLVSHEIHTMGAMSLMRQHVNEGVTPQRVRSFAREFQGRLQHDWDSFRAAGYDREDITFEVRACEYRAVRVEEELVEL